jgi:hypothetical protein
LEDSSSLEGHTGETFVFLGLQSSSLSSCRAGVGLLFESGFLCFAFSSLAILFSHPGCNACFLLGFEFANGGGKCSVDGLLSTGVLRCRSFGGGRVLLSLVVSLGQSRFLSDEGLTGTLVRGGLIGKCLGLGGVSLLFCDRSRMSLLLLGLFRSHLGCVLGRLCLVESLRGVDLGLDAAHIFAV